MPAGISEFILIFKLHFASIKLCCLSPASLSLKQDLCSLFMEGSFLFSKEGCFLFSISKDFMDLNLKNAFILLQKQLLHLEKNKITSWVARTHCSLIKNNYYSQKYNFDNTKLAVPSKEWTKETVITTLKYFSWADYHKL